MKKQNNSNNLENECPIPKRLNYVLCWYCKGKRCIGGVDNNAKQNKPRNSFDEYVLAFIFGMMFFALVAGLLLNSLGWCSP